MLQPANVTDVAGAMLNAPRDKRALTAALGFERQLVAQLAKSLLPHDLAGADSPYADVLPEALADGIEQAGGLGLAPMLAQSLGGQR